MSNSELFYEAIQDLKNKKTFFIMCDGYDGWSYGYPVNPICFSFEEYKSIVAFFQAKFNYALEDRIISHSGWDCILPDAIVSFTKKKVCTFTKFPSSIKIQTDIPTENDWGDYLFKTKKDEQKSIQDKERLIFKMKNLN